ncbi:MAG TPA: hypothetical protein VMR33_13145 [Candidatus Baltobacteraceae bacterium]|jgi:hypothetical protein|nr:hypothetical protein [Candidatus Baltobacteraceae bacterium]
MAMAQPTNDNFADRTPINFNTGSISGTISDATSQVGEPRIPGISSGQTAWWTWTAKSNGILTITSAAANFIPFVSVYVGNALSDLSLVASNNYLPCYVFPYNGEISQCGCHWRMRDWETFHVFRGMEYQICVDSPVVTDSSMVEVMTPVTFTNSDGTVQTFYMGSIEAVETTNVPPGGGVDMALLFTPAPPNDDFANAFKLAGSRTRIATSNKGSTKEPGEPDHDGNPGGSSVWFSWVAPESGRVTLSTNAIPPYTPPSSGNPGGVIIVQTSPFYCGELEDVNPPPQFYPLLAAYTGTVVDALTSANYLPMGLDAYPYAVEFDAVKGQTYHIAFDGNMGTTGDITLFLSLTGPAANDIFKNRIQLHGINAAATGYNAGAMHEPGAPVVPGSTGKNSWWTWTAPVSGTVSIDLTGSDYAFPVGVFTGTTVSNLTLAAAGSGSVSFQSVQGKAYQITVADAGGLTGKIKFALQAPVVELALLGTPLRSDGLTLLTYGASVGQIVLLQSSSSTGNSTWKNLRTATAHQDNVNFAVSNSNIARGTSYRAIVVDYITPP